MLFMDVSTWEPSSRDKILEHFKKLQVPEGIDVINSGLTFPETAIISFMKQRVPKHMELSTCPGRISA